MGGAQRLPALALASALLGALCYLVLSNLAPLGGGPPPAGQLTERQQQWRRALRIARRGASGDAQLSDAVRRAAALRTAAARGARGGASEQPGASRGGAAVAAAALAAALALSLPEARRTYPMFDGWLRGEGGAYLSELALQWPALEPDMREVLSEQATALFQLTAAPPEPTARRKRSQPLLLAAPVPALPEEAAARCPRVFEEASQRPHPAKKFVYLIQGPSRPRDRCIAPGSCYPPEDGERDVIWLTYQKKSHVAGDLYLPTKWWSEGRNALLREATRRAAQMRDGGYLFYVLTDDDAFPVPREDDGSMRWSSDPLPEDGWERWEAWLSHVQPAMGWIGWYYPHIHPAERFSSLFWNADHATTAYHREAMPFLLPFVRNFDTESWLYCQWMVDMLAGWFYATAKQMISSVSLNNTKHRRYGEVDEAAETREGGRGPYRKMEWSVPARHLWFQLNAAGKRVLCPTYTEQNPSLTRGKPRPRKNLTYVFPDRIWRRIWSRNASMAKMFAEFHDYPPVAALLSYLRCKDHRRERRGWNGTFRELDTVWHRSNGRRRKGRTARASDTWRDRPPEPEYCDPEWRVATWDDTQEWQFLWNVSSDPHGAGL